MSDTDNSLAGLRAALFETLRGVKAGTIDLDKARQVNELGKTLVDTARVEVEFMRATGAEEHSGFIRPAGGDGQPALPNGAGQANVTKPTPPGNGIVGITRHVLRG